MADLIAAIFALAGFALFGVAIAKASRPKRRQWRDRPRLPSFIIKE